MKNGESFHESVGERELELLWKDVPADRLDVDCEGAVGDGSGELKLSSVGDGMRNGDGDGDH